MEAWPGGSSAAADWPRPSLLLLQYVCITAIVTAIIIIIIIIIITVTIITLLIQLLLLSLLVRITIITPLMAAADWPQPSTPLMARRRTYMRSDSNARNAISSLRLYYHMHYHYYITLCYVILYNPLRENAL